MKHLFVLSFKVTDDSTDRTVIVSAETEAKAARIIHNQFGNVLYNKATQVLSRFSDDIFGMPVIQKTYAEQKAEQQDYPIKSHRFRLQVCNVDGNPIKNAFWEQDVKELEHIPNRVRRILSSYGIKLNSHSIAFIKVHYLRMDGSYQEFSIAQKLAWIEKGE